MKTKLTALALATTMALAACNPNTTQSNSVETPTAAVEQQQLRSGIFVENMDLTVNPGDDFFRYVNGTFLDTNKIPADRASYGAFSKLSDDAQEDVIAIIRESAEGTFALGTDEQKVGDMYTSFMDMETRNALGLKPLKESFKQIDAIQSHSDLAAHFAFINRYGWSTPIGFFQYADFKSPNDYGLYLWQGGLGLPDREYYFKEGEASDTIRDEYKKHIETIFTLAGRLRPTGCL